MLTISREADATPLCRHVVRTLRSSLEHKRSQSLAERLRGMVGLRSVDTDQAVTITFTGSEIHVARGIDAAARLVLDVSVVARITGQHVFGPDDDEELGRSVLSLLDPPIPTWRDAAKHFWDVNLGTPGMPDVLIVTSTDDDERLVLGAGPTTYGITGTSEELALVLDGSRMLVAALSVGSLSVQGSLRQLSVMVGASMKVRFDG
jgi:hypothetical protein